MKLIVTAHEVHYAGKAYLRGDILDASEQHGALLKLLKKADDAPEVTPEPVGEVASTQAPEIEPTVSAPRRYRTRALKAEG